MSTPCSPRSRAPGRFAALLLVSALAHAQVAAGDPPEAPGREAATPTAASARDRYRSGSPAQVKAIKLAARQATRTRARAHARRFQLEYRTLRQTERESRLRAAEEAAAWARLQELQRNYACSGLEPPRPNPRQFAAGVACLALLGLAALSEPSILLVLAQGSHEPMLHGGPAARQYLAEATESFEELGPACATALLSGSASAPCVPSYQRGVLAQLATVGAQVDALLVDPAELGAGTCLAGETPAAANQRLDLFQSDLQSAFNKLNAEASALGYQLDRDAYALEAAGYVLLTTQAAATAAGVGTTGAASDLAFAAGEAGNGLVAVNYLLQAGADLMFKVSSVALTAGARYQLWADGQRGAIVANCSGVAAPAGTAVAPAPPVSLAGTSPHSSLADAQGRLALGCELAGQKGLALKVCGPDTLAALQAHNATLTELYGKVACLSAGVQQGGPTHCLGAASPASPARSQILLLFTRFLGEISAAGYAVQVAGNGLFGGARFLLLAGNTAARAGDTTAANGLFVAENSMIISAAALLSDGYDLLRIGALSRSWVTEFTRLSNAESRARLDAQEQAPPPSSTGGAAPSSSGPGTDPIHTHGQASTAPFSSTGSSPDPASAPAAPGGSLDAPGGSRETGSTPGASASTPAQPPGPVAPGVGTAARDRTTSDASRNRPLSLRTLVQLLLPSPPSAPPGREEL